jgi:hypothetical protein
MNKIERMAGLVGADVKTLSVVTAAYGASRGARKSAKKSHTAATETAAAILGTHDGAWDYATWAQNLVDTQLVTS